MFEIVELLLEFLISLVDLIELTLNDFVGLSVFKLFENKFGKMRVYLSLFIEFVSEFLTGINESGVFFF